MRLAVKMFLSIAIASSSQFAAEPVSLNNDAPYQAALDNVKKSPVPPVTQPEDYVKYLFELAQAEAQMRHYGLAEQHMRKILDAYPTWAVPASLLSVMLGKQGKYKEAEQMALKALELDPANPFYPNLVLASWEYHLGKKEAALKRFSSIPVPDDATQKRTYYGCMACFFASVGDEQKVEQAIRKSIELDTDKSFQPFLDRDIILDPYRGNDWFIKLAGKTLLDSESKK
jgi:tetratricopeptide (TPR) repeat protein